MSKRLFYLIFLSFLVFSLSGCKWTQSDKGVSDSSVENKASNMDNNNYKNTDTNKTDNEHQNNSSTTNSTYTITSDENPIWKKEEHEAAIKFAHELVNLIKNKNLSSISKKVSYPIKIKIDGQDTIISNEQQFASFDFNKIFNEKLIKEINNSTKLFSNQNGFCLGSDSNVWFSPMSENGEIKIIAINN